MNQQTFFHFPVKSLSGCRWKMHDRGTYLIDNDVLTISEGWASLENTTMENICFEFNARCPKTSSQVQIWAGFRHYSRDYRYVVALRGGNNNHIYLARMGAEGYDKMLALRPLEWSPVPGEWYHIKVICIGQEIAVYLNDDPKPLLHVKDDAPFTSGSISLGGSFIPTEFKNVSVKQVSSDFQIEMLQKAEYLSSVSLSPEEKESARIRERAMYRPYVIPALPEERMELSLNGKWLFIPDYEVTEKPLDLNYDDSRAHTMTVPASWTPLQAWLEGESMHNLNKGMNDTFMVEETTRCLNQTFDYKTTNYAWYRHYLDFPKDISTKRIVLDFEGIALISAIYFNGTKVHENIGMFAPMQIDVTDYVTEGRNVIAIEVHRTLNNESEKAVNTSTIDDHYATAWDILDADGEMETRFERREFCTDDIPHGFYLEYPGGIWRNVRLIITNKLHIDECFFIPTLEDAAIEVKYSNTGNIPTVVSLAYSLVHKCTGEYLCGGVIETATLAAGQSRRISFTTPKVTPRLWGPGTPNLYDLTFRISQDGEILDTFCEKVGFRTVSFDGQTLLYNNQPMWIRGGNHMPAHIKPNDHQLAKKFMELALSHNCMATRTHVAPWTSVWLNAADETGLMVSFEGTWTWLMLEHIPSKQSIHIWKEELAQLLKRHRNRPSLFLMTMNNEMKFYLHEAPDEVVIEKGRILQDGVELVRRTVPHLPLVCDSAYFRKHAIKSGRYDRIIKANNYDDGDMDDPHGYFGWYNPCFFHFMNGEFGEDYTVPGRPCMSQECSTGYPRAEDGSPTRAYLYLHQTPQTTVGKKSYEYNDPSIFLQRHAMLTKELLEMFRRVEHDRTCGVMLFAFETWFYHQNDYNRIQPMISARSLKTAYQPVLASAELWGRHFYSGDILHTNITLINDSANKETLISPTVQVSLMSENNVLCSAELNYDNLPYFCTAIESLALPIPELLQDRTEAKLILKVKVNDSVISRNEYDILLASENWGKSASCNELCYYLHNDTLAFELLNRYGITANACTDLSSIIGKQGRLIISGSVTKDDAVTIHKIAQNGCNVVLLGQKNLPEGLLGTCEAPFTEHRQEIITMNIPESTIFDGIEELDTAWFSDGRNVPYVAFGRYSVDRFNRDICVLAETLEWHGYINKPTDYKNFGGTPLFSVKVGSGHILVSALRTDAVSFDPISSRLTANILSWDFDQQQ